MKAILVVVGLLFTSNAFAQEASTALNLMSMLTSLIAVVLLILILAWLVKRLNPQFGASAHFKIVRSMPLGARERLLVVEIDDKQHLLGVTPHSINYLYQLENPLPQSDMPKLAEGLSAFLKTAKKNE
jgi:flagellar protein FliO/FliZ